MDLFEQQRIAPINIEDEIKVSYLDYAMSVIIGRALPDARDGLKPVHRRILFAMSELGNDYNKPHKKSARVVGDVIGKYHPHGDQSVYDALVRLAQDWAMRYPLADGQGNFGSVDGDPAAAMRYTEVRMAKLAHEYLADIDKKTIDFIPNYDGAEDEPSVLPTRVPGLLVNGSAGIAVGMATNIPPHNLGEVANGLAALIDNPDITIDELMNYIPGPDFPTGGFILGREGLREAYHTGRGIIRIRARAVVEAGPKEKKSLLVIKEIPYQVNKANLVGVIDGLIRDKKLEGVSEVRDESDRDGFRVVLEVKAAQRESTDTILNQLYRQTQLEVSFGLNLLAVVNQAPRVMTLKECLVQFLEHRKEVVRRRTRFELDKAEARAHILEGLLKALDHLDEIIARIRQSQTPPEARRALMSRFEFSELQAQAILELRLQKLTGLERQGLIDEYQALIKDIEYYRAVLASEKILLGVIRDETLALKNDYSDERRTQITDVRPGDYNPEDFIVDEDMVVTISHGGYIKRTPATAYKSQKRGGKGVTAAKTKEDDFVERLYIATTHSYLLFLTNRGRLYWLKVHEVPEAGRMSKGKALVNVVAADKFEEGEKVATVLAVKDLSEPERYVVMATRAGTIKRVELSAFQNPRKAGIIAMKVAEDDELVSASLTDGQSALILSTRYGKAICFDETEVRSMGRAAAGVRGLTLAPKDYLVGLEVIAADRSEVLMAITEKGYGKRVLASEYRLQSRGGQGAITIARSSISQKGLVVGVLKVTDEDRLMLITNTGRLIMFKVSEIRVKHRNAGGVTLIKLEEGEVVKDVAPVGEADDELGAEEAMPQVEPGDPDLLS
ncbi:MAG: DNA gyrase subunit A [Candidatus Adiutrix sp.]|jgi:DNA gyrase subunit A|nr:DNA gyrase subunit A [Candidatus Adiutrix sp.]